MDSSPKFNVVVIGVSCFDGMASSIRVRNLLDTEIFKNSVILNNLIYKVDAHGLDKKRGVQKGITFLVVNASSILSLFSATWQGIGFIRKSKSKSCKNIIYNYQYIDIKNILLLLYARLVGYKIVFDIVEDNKYYTTFVNLKSKLKIATSIKFLKLTPRIGHHVITISHHLLTMMTKVCSDKISVSLIPITVNLDRFPIESMKTPTTFKIFYGGSFGLKDGIEYLIKAFGKLSEKNKNVELVMTGRASEEDFQTLKGYLGESDASEIINHLGFLDDDLYYETLNTCHIFCMTRTNSKFANAGFPFKLGEFLATGKAVIATKVGDIPNYLKHGKNALLITPESVSELEKALQYLLNNPEKITAIGKEGRLVAEKNFDTYSWSSRLKDIFESI